MEKATRGQTKDHNSRLVLKTIYDAGSVSRAEVARLTALTRPTVSALVAELIEGGLVVETGQGPSAGGKPPTLVTLHGDGRRLLALDLSGGEFRGALVNLRGEIDRRVVLPAASLRGEAALARVYELADSLLPTPLPLLGIGVATPGLVAPRLGIVLRAVNLGWANLPLGDLLAARYGHPVHVANDSHMAALAEYTFGVGRETPHLITIRIGQGIGAGVILDGRPFYGDGFGAGEIGHVVIDPAGELCSCGNRGCLETTSSTRAILRRAAEADRSGSALAGDPPTWERFAAAVAARDPLAVEIAAAAGCHLGAAVAHLVGAYNVQTIVMAGRIADLGDTLLNAVRAEMRRRVLPAMADATTIRYTSLGDRAGDIIILGCSALVLHRELGIV